MSLSETEQRSEIKRKMTFFEKGQEEHCCKSKFVFFKCIHK